MFLKQAPCIGEFRLWGIMGLIVGRGKLNRRWSA